MANKMLIDATHPEETRVVVLRGSRVEEFDFESASKRQLRGNIYLAKVIRVEPSLQAAFVDYGGNRHGFLAFSEIHPDYYQIPVSDRQALLEDEAQQTGDDDEDERPRRSRRRRGDRHASAARRTDDDTISETLETGEQDGGGAAGVATEVQAESPASSDDDGDRRPVQLEASQTPPYDDPTGELVRHATEVHDQLPAGTSDDPAPAASTASEQGTTAQPLEPATLSAADGASPARHPEAHPLDDAAGSPLTIHGSEQTAESLHADAPLSGEPSAFAVPTTDADVDTGSSIQPAAANRDMADQQATTAGEALDDTHEHHDEDEQVDQLGGDALEEIPHRAFRSRRQYKIQEVIKRRQVLLVQVVKEERGNKGAALTTYLSLAGRYSVLMPNTARGGGISRKITDATDRQRLKSIAQELEVPEGMGVILRTAGASRTKPEVKRDFEYLMRMWETVRETTLASSAPTLVYEEGSLIKRAIRDLYNKDVEEILVSGENGYREAKEFMRLLMPSHSKNVQPWRDPAPLFAKAGAEAQLDAMFSNHVTLKSGGYLVINQTEALVAIDVNSGRSTREHNIEDTALRTNLEASDEVARQLRLRDLAGLIVVDFIDMEEMRNNRAVERRLKEALKDDRARIQVGRISHFGLLEMSRQRIRTGVLEGSTEICAHCAGAGTVRSTASIALHVLRVLEEALLADASRDLTVRTRGAIALYILNQKRSHLTNIEGRFGVAVTFEADEHLTGTTYCGLERGEPATGVVVPVRQIVEISEPEIVEEVEPEERDAEADETTGDDRSNQRRRRRRRGRGRESSGIREDAEQPSDDALGILAATEAAPAETAGTEDGQSALGSEPSAEPEGGDDETRSRRRRSRRGGRRTRDARQRQADGSEGGEDLAEGAQAGGAQAEIVRAEGNLGESAPTASASSAVAADGLDDTPMTVVGLSEPSATPTDERPVDVAAMQPAQADAAPQDATVEPRSADPNEEVDAEQATQTARQARPEPVSSEADPSRPKRSGWWQRAKATITG